MPSSTVAASTVSRMASPWSVDLGDGAELLDDSGEHQLLLGPLAGVMVRRTLVSSPSWPCSTVDVGDVEVQGVGDGGDAEVGDRAGAGAEQHRGDVGDDLVDQPGGQEGPARGWDRPRGTRAGGRSAWSSASASCGSRVRRCTVSARSLKTRRSGGEVAQPHHRAQRLHGHRLVDLVAHGQLGVVDLDGVGADEHRVAQRAQAVGVEPGRPAGDPAARAVGGGAATVEGGGELPGDEGAAARRRRRSRPG